MNREIVDDDIWAPVPRESDLWRYGIAAIEHIPQPIKEENVSKKEFFLFFTDAAVRGGEPRAFVSDDEHVSGACAQKESQQQQYKMFNESSLNSNNKRRSKNEIKRNEKPTDKLAATRESIHIWRQRCRTRLRAQQHRS